MIRSTRTSHDPDAAADAAVRARGRGEGRRSSSTLGDRRFEEGKEATENADKYVFATVFFAIVLFFSGVSLRFEWWRLRIVMVAGSRPCSCCGASSSCSSLPVH